MVNGFMKKKYIIPEVGSAPIKMGNIMDSSVAGPGAQEGFLAPERRERAACL